MIHSATHVASLTSLYPQVIDLSKFDPMCTTLTDMESDGTEPEVGETGAAD
jgi:hypothetical protein